jgi:hypothetical protein
MTPKEKAKELFKRYIELTQEWDELDGYIVNKYNAKQCALIAIELSKEFVTGDLDVSFDKFLYLQEVEQEIKKL